MEILRPLLAETGAEPIGKVVIGTVKGDIHDIGKNLVAMMLEGAGFEVVDLGINTDADAFLAAIDEHQPDIIGMSALLTTTMPYMKVVIDTLKERGLRDKYIVLVGGAPLNEEFGQAVGADAYCRDAAVAAETAKQLVAARRGNPEPPGPSVALIPCPGRRPSCSPAAPSSPSCAPCLAANDLTDRVEVRYLPANLHNRPERIVPAPARPARRTRPRRRPRRCSSATPTAAPEACSTRCWRNTPTCVACRATTATSSSPAAPPSTSCRAVSRHLLPHRLPRQALPGAGLGRARPRPSPRAAARVLRQLHPARAALPDRRRDR